MDRIDLSTVPSAMEATARAWGARPTPPAPIERVPPPRKVVDAPRKSWRSRPFAERSDRGQPGFFGQDAGERKALSQAVRDAWRAIAAEVPDPREKARILPPELAHAMVNAAHSGNRDYYLRPDTPVEVQRALFSLGCVGSRGPHDRRYWLGPYGSRVRKALLGELS